MGRDIGGRLHTIKYTSFKYSPNITNSVPFTSAIHVQLNHVLKIKKQTRKTKKPVFTQD